MTSFYIPFALTVLSMATYHVAQKLLSSSDSPFSLLAAAYAVAAVLCIGAAMFAGSTAGESGAVAHPSARDTLHQVFSLKNWPVLLLAVAVVGIEVGILFTYKYGASMGTLPLLTNAGLLIITVPVGALFFREHVSMSTLAGGLCVLGGFWLMTRHA
ncbi:hypothetical protein N1030_09300 [Desulfovibrio mangrovi]|uniref:hypothetical protein n=1 Tax=Desulfovibrio mangrovi TaxID=2976983 RepID=UPI002245F4AB|nr:hypothetical protein [Desulfovibrio mangrovi]UZP65826.1 hypothetical protein N1030_09300 [Desulfovibrio mangrovi]